MCVHEYTWPTNKKCTNLPSIAFVKKTGAVKYFWSKTGVDIMYVARSIAKQFLHVLSVNQLSDWIAPRILLRCAVMYLSIF